MGWFGSQSSSRRLAFGVGSEVDGCDVTVSVKEVLDEDMDGDMFVSDLVVMVDF